MDWDNREKVHLKLSNSWLVARQSPENPWGLFYVQGTGDADFSFQFTPTNATRRAADMTYDVFRILDIRKFKEIKFTSPPVGYLNLTKQKTAVSLARSPRRAYKLGLHGDVIDFREVTDRPDPISIQDMYEPDYTNLLLGNYPKIGEVSGLLKGKVKSVALSQNHAVFKNALGIHILEVAGTPMAWFWEGKVQLIELTSRELLEATIKCNIKDLAMEIKNAE